MADSMRSRGYGSGKRTTFAKYRFDTRNLVLTLIMAVFIGITIFCAANGATQAEYVPYFTMSWFGDVFMFLGVLTYAVFLLIPVFLDIKETIKWHILRSKI